MDADLVCNFKKCRKPLTSYAWATSCSHIFCNEDGSREFEKHDVCPACNTQLSSKSDIVRVDLNPTDEYKAMVLAGQKPEVIMETCSRALAFWAFQVQQETRFQQYLATKARDKMAELEQHYEQVLQKVQAEFNATRRQLDSTKAEMETYRKQLTETQEKLAEKKRQHEKLRSKYETFRRKTLSPPHGVDLDDHQFERRSSAPITCTWVRDASNLPTANDILTNRNRDLPRSQLSVASVRPKEVGRAQSTVQDVFKVPATAGRAKNHGGAPGDWMSALMSAMEYTPSTLPGYTSIRSNSAKK